jgi:hypothetical protein
MFSSSIPHEAPNLVAVDLRATDGKKKYVRSWRTMG